MSINWDNYNPAIPFKLGLFSLVVTGLIIYFFYITRWILTHRDKKLQAFLLFLHVLLMAFGLFLTGFAGSVL